MGNKSDKTQDPEAPVIDASMHPMKTQNGEEQEEAVGFTQKKRRGCGSWCKKFFWEGQTLEEQHQENVDCAHAALLPQPERFILQHRRQLALVLPSLVFHFFWWSFMIKRNLFHIYADKYFMPLTMIFGSLVAGMTSEGGGAVAFPMMTLAFGISPIIARDFSLMIQSAGMSCASLAILLMKVQLEWVALISASLGGVFGLIIGFHLIDPHLTTGQKKMGFGSIWFSFAFALFLLNWNHKRRTFNRIPNLKVWKVVVLFVTGVIGSIFTSFAGNGLDICTFSILTLLFRISEKVATPTSVILMAVNSLVGCFWRELIMQDVSQVAYDFFYICAGVVVIGAPLGSVLGSHFHRLVLACLIYLLDTITLIIAFIVVPLTPQLIGMSVGIIIGGGLFFYVLTLGGNKLLQKFEEGEELMKVEEHREDDLCIEDNNEE